MLLCACGGNSSASEPSSAPDSSVTLEDLSELLTGELARKETENSNRVEFEEKDIRGDARTFVSKETAVIYSDRVTVFDGTEKAIYTSSDQTQTLEDTYQSVAAVKDYGGQEIFYLVKDFKDGTVKSDWIDSADRLPIYATGDANYDGVDYLLESSVPAQLTKQVSAFTNYFIRAHLLGNPDLQMYMPKAEHTSDGTQEVYSLKDFSYSYRDDDGSDVTVLTEFEIRTEECGLVSSRMRYSTTTVRDDEIYVEDDVTSYKVSYGERVSSAEAGDLIEPEDYFIGEVSKVRAYIYNDQGKKEYVDADNLPIGKYVRFEASSYLPEKAVDLEMYATSSSNESVIAATSNVFETKASGAATIGMVSATGVPFTLNVRVNIPPLSRIKYDDASSDIERVRGSSGDVAERYIYTDTVYDSGIYISVSPSGALLDDIEISVSDSSVLTAEIKSKGSSVLELKLTVSDRTNDSSTVALILSSKADETVKTTITYHLKKRLTADEMVSKLMGNTYRWNNLYNYDGSDYYALMTFVSASEGKIRYYNGEESIDETTFTYSIEGTAFDISVQGDALYGYNGGEITLDGENITLRVDETKYVHYYTIVKENA